jgi:hypothetical protein
VAPAVSGSSTTGSTLSCSPGTWAPDLPESFLYRAPQHFAYGWSEDGVPIAAASSSITAHSPGSYACQVTASNFAGTAVQTSASFTVTTPPLSSVAVTSRNVSPSGAITLGVLVHVPGTLTGTAAFTQKSSRITGSRRHRHRVVKSRNLVYGAASLSTTSAGVVVLIIRPTNLALKLLKANKKITVNVALSFAPEGGAIIRAALRVLVRAPRPAVSTLPTK